MDETRFREHLKKAYAAGKADAENAPMNNEKLHGKIRRFMPAHLHPFVPAFVAGVLNALCPGPKRAIPKVRGGNMTNEQLSDLTRPYFPAIVAEVRNHIENEKVGKLIATGDEGHVAVFSAYENHEAELTAADAKRYAEYFAPDAKGRYPGTLHREFNLGVREFSDAAEMQLVQLPSHGGSDRWQWVPRPPQTPGVKLRNALADMAVRFLHDNAKSVGPVKSVAELSSRIPAPLWKATAQAIAREYSTHPEYANALRTASMGWGKSYANDRAKELAKKFGGPAAATDGITDAATILGAAIAELCRLAATVK